MAKARRPRAPSRPTTKVELERALKRAEAERDAAVARSEAIDRARREDLEQQVATAEILRIISGSPSDVQPVFDAIAASALRLCDGAGCVVVRFDGARMHLVAQHTPVPEVAAVRERFPMTPDRSTGVGRAIVEGAVVHIADITGDAEYDAQMRQAAPAARSVLAVPMLREGRPIGAISVGGRDAEPFAHSKVELLKTFADQAVIAIENVRLFTELQEKNRALTESLDQQTATSEILEVMSASPTDIQPVFDTIADRAMRLLNGDLGFVYVLEGELVHVGGLANLSPEGADVVRRAFPVPPSRGTFAGRAILTRDVVHVVDALEDREYALGAVAQTAAFRSCLVVPMLRDGVALGAIAVTRAEPGTFSETHIALLKTFADQAVIAIENVRLFTELQEKNRALTVAHAQVTAALERQTATAEILAVISSSPTNIDPVLNAVATTAARLCEAVDAVIMRLDGAHLRVLAHHGGEIPLQATVLDTGMLLSERTVTGQAIADKSAVHVADLANETERYPEGAAYAKRLGFHTALAVPLLRERQAIGAILVRRQQVRPFSDKQIELLQIFADQAVIAIENVRLFTELQESNRELRTALDTQTATSDILRVISRSQTDVQPVFEAIVQSAVRLCDGLYSQMFLSDGEFLDVAATYNVPPSGIEALKTRYPVRISSGEAADRLTVRAMSQRRILQIADMQSESNPSEDSRLAAAAIGHRAVIAVPMLREDEPVGVLIVSRREAEPFAENEGALLRTFADQAVIAIENARLFTALQERTRDLARSVDQLTALGEVSRAVSSTLDLDRVLNTVVLRAGQLAVADGCSIFEYDGIAGGFRMRATSQVEPTALDARRTALVPAGEGAVGRLTETRAPVQIPDISSTEAYRSPLRDTLLAGGYRALLAVPMIQDDQVVGGLVVSRKASGEFPSETIELLQTFANQSALAIANARLFREIEEKSAQLEVANQHKSEFLASMSHELRTPLNAIIGFSDVLLEGMFGETNEKQTEYLRDILSSGQHLLSLINDILDLSKIEAGRMELDVTTFDLPAAIDDAILLMRERAGRRGITLQRRLDEKLGAIQADQRKVKQVLLNLLSNALKFTPEGGRIDVRAGLTDGVAEISVTDTGIGIAPEDQGAVFEEFRQVGKAEKKAEGTGLGLALCRKFVELHGGTIGVESRVGVGSTFTFTVPVQQSNT